MIRKGSLTLLLFGALQVGVACAQQSSAGDGLPGAPQLGQASGDDRRDDRREERLRRRLLAEAERAVGADNFSERVTRSAEAIGSEAAQEAARALGLEEAQRAELHRIFRRTALEAGEEFRDAFSEGGARIRSYGSQDPREREKELEREAVYRRAKNAPGGVALLALGPALQAVDPYFAARGRASLAFSIAENAVRRATLDDVAKLVARDLGLKEVPASGQRLIEAIKVTVPPIDSFHPEVDKLVARGPGLQSAELEILDLATRLSNASQRAGHAHVATWESPLRVEAGHHIFDRFDEHKRRLYRSTLTGWQRGLQSEGLPAAEAEAEAQRRAFARVAFEVYKSVLALKQASDARVATTKAFTRFDSERYGFRKLLEAERVRLAGLEQHELVEAARAAGIEVRSDASRRQLLERLGAPSGVTLEASAPAATGFKDILERTGARGRGGPRRAR